jgi:hypothetical protein
MLNISTRLATLDPKARAATRTAKDGEEYSQLVLEVSEFDFEENELNAACGSASAYRQVKAMFEQCPSVGFVELDEKIERASIVMRLAAVSERNGEEFAFKDCRVDKLRVNREMKGSLRMTTKPALDSKFGQLIERLGHTVMFQANGSSNSDQKELPLNKVGAKESPKSSIGSPQQEREKARERELNIAADLDTVKRAAKHGSAKKKPTAKRR